MDGDVDLLVSADVGGDGSDTDISSESEERQEHEEDGAFKDGSLQDGMVGVGDPQVTDVEANFLGVACGAVGINHELEGLVVALLVGHVGPQGSHHTLSGWQVTSKACLK
jgi:hypothetical protein